MTNKSSSPQSYVLLEPIATFHELFDRTEVSLLTYLYFAQEVKEQYCKYFDDNPLGIILKDFFNSCKIKGR